MSNTLADPEQTRNRLEILNEFFRGTWILNGSACVALFAFVQQIWTEGATVGFVRGLLSGGVFFVIGLVCSVLAQYLRYETSKAIQFERSHGRALQNAYFRLAISSLIAFAIGAILIFVVVWIFAGDLPLWT